MANSVGNVWPKILTSLEEGLPRRTVANWFERASPELRDGDPTILLLTLPSSFHRDHIRDQYYSDLLSACQEVFNREVEIQLRVDKELGSEPQPDDSKTAPHSPGPTEMSQQTSRKELQARKSHPPSSRQPRSPAEDRSSSPVVVEKSAPSKSRGRPQSQISSSRPGEFHRSSVKTDLKDRYTFDNFVEGDSNALAKSASTAVADQPGGTNYNPLLIYGGVGLGKTHLAQAIASYAITHQTAEFVCYKSGEEFTSEFVAAIRQGEGGKFSQKYKGVDLLILDDIQFFEGKEKTQEEFFHLFNALYQQNRQIVLCADRPPKDIDGIEDRLLSRFEWGLSTDVQQPTLETRLAILQMKAEALGLEVNQEVLDLMAESLTTNVRQLEGALKKLSARADLMGTQIDVEAARRFLEDQIQLPESTSVDAEDVLNAVTSYYGISHDDLVGRSRRKELVHPRHVAMYLCRELTSLSFAAIGLRFGGRDHSTVSHGCEKINDRLDVRLDLGEEIEGVKREVHRSAARS